MFELLIVILSRFIVSFLFLGKRNPLLPQPSVNIFYYNVEVVNNETKILLEWTLGSERKSQVLDVKSVTRMVNELRTTVPQPPGVTFRAYKFDDRSPLLINNDDEVEVLPSSQREEFALLEVTTTKGVNFLAKSIPF